MSERERKQPLILEGDGRPCACQAWGTDYIGTRNDGAEVFACPECKRAEVYYV